MGEQNVPAAFTVTGSINSRAALEAELDNIYEILETANADVVSLLNRLVHGTPGLMEAVLVSRSNDGFAFRSRIMKALHKSSETPDSIYQVCAERMGRFLAGLPPSINVDRRVMEQHNSFTDALNVVNSPEPKSPVPKTPQPVAHSPPKSTKRKQKFIPLSISIGPPVPKKDKLVSVSPTQDRRQPSSPVVALNGPKSQSFPELLRTSLEAYFAACMEDGIEEFAADNLLAILSPSLSPQLSAKSPRSFRQFGPFSPLTDITSPESPTFSRPESLPYFSLAPNDIAQYLAAASSPKFGDWPVVVSQRGIKHLKQYVETANDVFLRIQKRIKQLSLGYFPPPNQTKLLDRDAGIPIYTSDLGGGLRLIYHIDFGAPTATTDESQFIRIFGVFHDAKIDIGFWKSVSAQLSRRGSEYIQRCAARGEPRLRSKGIQTIPPKLFAPLDISHWNKDGADIEIDESHFLELHRILALEKFVPLSQTFFEAIQKYDENSFMFAVSSPEYRIIKHPSSCLVLGRSGTGKTTCMMFRMIGLDIVAEKYGHPLRQMFVTQSRTLARKVRSYSMQLRQTEANVVGVQPGESLHGLSLMEMDENAEEQGVLPARFSELDDSHFPLFITYDQLCRLLEADYELQFNPSTLFSSIPHSTKTLGSPLRQPLVSFDYFESNIWPHFDERLKKGLHAALVYSEFMGVIKGSEDSLNKSRHYLERKHYEKRGRTHSGDETERTRIYSLFEAYQKLRPPASYDVADRVHALIEALREHGLKGQYIDFLYVDEAQDNLIIDAALLRTLCPNPHGLFFAGDTAQTISVGSAFRFSELKAFMYRLEREDTFVKRGRRKAIDPSFFQLSTNYRSHSGIVNVAAFVVRLLSQYFQHSIDSLLPEVSLVDVSAHKPVFFSGREERSDFVRLISDSESGNVQLGAHQVIIVRDENAAQRLEAEIGRVAVILTLYESKGMEFDDVLLYDFFTDSAATPTDWRAILLSQHDGRVFDERKHSILQSELKSFYVGLTRARERVWIWDRSRNGQDMENLLVTSLLATAYDINQSVPQLGASSTAKEWKKQARQYFSKSLYGEAAFCFTKAGMNWWASVALAYGDRQMATRLPDKHSRRLSAFAEVAQNFDRLAQALGKSEDPNNALLLFINAGECYAVIPNHLSAAEAFYRGQKFTEAAYHYRMQGMFDEALDVIKTHPVDPDVARSIEYAAKLVFSRKRDVQSLHKAREICESKDEFLEFLQDHGFEDQRIQFLESITEHEEAAAVFWRAKDHVEAISRFLISTKPSSGAKAAECLLDGLRFNITLGFKSENALPVVSKLLDMGQELPLDPKQRIEVSLFQAIILCGADELLTHGRYYADHGKLHTAFLAFDAWVYSGALKGLEIEAIDQVANLLRVCQQYCSLVQTVIQGPDLLEKPEMQQIFGISWSSNSNADDQDIKPYRQVHPQSFIHAKARDQEPQSDEAVTVPTLSRDVVDDLIRNTLLERRNQVLGAIHFYAHQSRALNPCTRFLVTGSCPSHQTGQCRRGHIQQDHLTIHSFNGVFRLHLLVIAVLDQVTAVDDASKTTQTKRSAMQRTWLVRIFDTCYPESHKMGNLSDITPDLIDGYASLIPILKKWLQEVFLSLCLSNDLPVFLSNLLRTSMLATAIDYMDTRRYLLNGKWFSDQEIASKEGFLQEDGRPIAGAVLTWFNRRTGARHNLGVYAVRHILARKLPVDVDVLSSYVEEVCGQLILNHFVHYMSYGYEGLTMPRSWLIRALMRQSSELSNGKMPYILIPWLRSLLEILVGRLDPGQLRYRGTPLRQSSLPILIVARVCRCLVMLGVNNRNARDEVLRAVEPLKHLKATPDLGLNRLIAAQGWKDVEDAAHLTIAFSTMDDLVTVTHTEEPSAFPVILGSRPVFCNSDVELLSALLKDPHVPLAAPLLHFVQTGFMGQAPPQMGFSMVPSPRVDETEPTQGASEIPGQLEGVEYTQQHIKSARIIQRLFRRHRRRAGGPIAAAFEEMAKRGLQLPEPYRPGQLLLLCLRGPLPHVLKFLQKLKDACQETISGLNKRIELSNHEELDALNVQGAEARRIRDETSKLYKELQPSFEHYFKGPQTAPLSVAKIVEKVGLVPSLINSLRRLAAWPDDVDYDLGVEPLLSNRVSWRSNEPATNDTRQLTVE